MEEKQSTNKNAIANSRLGIFLKDSGELIDDGDLIYVPKKVRISGFFMGMQVGFEYLAKSNLNREALNVLLFMISRMDYENVIRISNKEICEAMSMKRQNVNRATRVLREAGVISPGEFHAVHLCSDIGWKGKVTNLRKEQADQTKSIFDRTKPNDEDMKNMDLADEKLSKYAHSAEAESDLDAIEKS